VTDAPGPQKLDGRTQRSRESHRRIVAAMTELVAAGTLTPSAEQIAEAAQVGLRSVFRHFKDMDTLYQEMAASVIAEMEAAARQAFKAGDWHGRVLELIDRRATAFEKIANFLRAAQVNRHRSAFLQVGQARFVVMLRRILLDLLPAETTRDTDLVDIIDLLLSPEAWRRLREEQGLDVARAKQVLHRAITAHLEQPSRGI
jgi:AcrR family transcriptional regulator